MGERRIAAEHLAVMQAHDATSEGIVDAVFNLVESVQQRSKPTKSEKESRAT
jgi:hypothetical protein